jgi:N-acetylmuramoyl-L-alanine amidase
MVIELGTPAQYQAARIPDPDRIYFDIENATLANTLVRESVTIPSGGYVSAVRIAENRPNVVRVVLEVTQARDYSVMQLSNPDRLVVDVYGSAARAAIPNSTQAVREPTPEVRPQAISQKSAAKPAESVPGTLRQAAARTGVAPIPQPTRDGGRSLTRALGLKIGRIVIDAGHGGHDTGTIGPTGLMEKDVSLDVALRLGKLINEKFPSAEVVYTRDADMFVPLEQRTAIANEAKADLFISIHTNSSSDSRVKGVETYYLNLAADRSAMEVATRENATAHGSVHELQELVSKITQNEKIRESRELAANVQEALAKRTVSTDLTARDRGVRKAPFVVLIGTNMPAVLTEISFLSNPADEQWLKQPANRQRTAEGLYHGIEKYLQSTNSFAFNASAAPAEPMTAGQ